MGKGFTGKQCYYCWIARSDTADHVFARQFFRVESRRLIPKVPACNGCNNHKSALETYLTAVLPFGSRQYDAHEAFDAVQSRLRKNAKLHRNLRDGVSSILVIENGVWRPTIALPFESAKLEEYVQMIALALHQFHWGVGQERLVSKAAFLEPAFAERHATAVAEASGEVVEFDPPDATFRYLGKRLDDRPADTSIWAFEVLGGMQLSNAAGVSPGTLFSLVFATVTTETEATRMTALGEAQNRAQPEAGS